MQKQLSLDVHHHIRFVCVCVCFVFLKSGVNHTLGIVAVSIVLLLCIDTRKNCNMMPKQSFIMILTIFLKTFFQITSKLKNWYITLFLKWGNGRGWGGIILNFIQYLHYKLYTKIVFLCSAHFVEYKCFLYCQDATEARIALRANNDTKGLWTRATNIALLIAIFPHDALRIISLKCRHWLRTWQLPLFSQSLCQEN